MKAAQTDTQGPMKTARLVTDALIERLDVKVIAGEWVNINAVRRELHALVTEYELNLKTMYDLCDSYEQMFVDAIEGIGEEE